MPPPSYFPLPSLRIPRPIASTPTAQNMRVQPDRYHRAASARSTLDHGPPTHPALLSHKRKVSDRSPVRRPMPYSPVIPLRKASGPTLAINPNTKAPCVVQPSAYPQGQHGVAKLCKTELLPWPLHNSFRDLVGLPHLNVKGEYIHPQVTRLHHVHGPPVRQQQPQQPACQQPTHPMN